MKIFAGIFLLTILAITPIHDLKIKHIRFMEVVEHGKGHKPTYRETRNYYPYKENTPDTIDIFIRIENNGTIPEKDIQVRLVITPKVSLLPATREHLDLGDLEKLRRSGTWLSPEIILEKNIDELKPHKSLDLKFEKIEMSYFLEVYYENSDNKYYPIELKFEATINPKDKEVSLENNIDSKILYIGPPE